jgi:hypothetical protein
MCDYCETGAPQRGIAPALAARARAIEAARPGERVPEAAWAILLGQVGGAVAWAHHARILSCLDAAGAELSACGGRPARRGLRCDAAA